MKKNLFRFLCSVLCVSMLAGCSTSVSSTDTEASASASAAPAVITITDHADNTVEVPADIQRIAVVGIYPLPSVLSVFFNSAEKIVAMPKQSLTAAQNGLLGQLYPEILNVPTDAVSGDSVNTEELLSLNPDVVFYSASDTAAGDALKNAGFTAVAVSVNKWGYNAIETLN